MFRRRIIRVGALAAALTLSNTNWAMATGIQSANRFLLSTGSKIQETGDPIHKFVSYTFTIVNGNSRDVFIRDVGQNGPGLQLLVPSGSGMNLKLIKPFGLGKTLTVLPHKSIGLTVWFQITNCAKVPVGNWPLPIDVSWGSGKWQRVGLQMPSPPSAQWQKFMADSVCP